MSQENYEVPEEELRAQAMVLQMLDTLNPKMPFTATVIFKVDKSKESAFKKNCDALTEATRKLPGIRTFSYHRQKPIQPEEARSDVVEYLIYQEWETVELFRTQFVSHHLMQFLGSVFDLIVAPPDLRFYSDAEEEIVMPQVNQPPSIDEIRADVTRMLDGLDPFMPISATVVFQVARNKEATFRANAEALQEATRKLPGCNVFVYQKHKPLQGEDTDPVEYLIYEDWQ